MNAAPSQHRTALVSSELRVRPLIALPWLDGARVLMALVFVASAFVDLPRLLIEEPFSGLAMLTVTYLCGGVLLLLTVPRSGTGVFGTTLPLWLFLIWAVLSLCWASAPRDGIQNIFAISIFVILTAVSYVTAALHRGSLSLLEKLLKLSTVIAMLGYAVALLNSGAGSDDVFSPRSFGLFALLGLAYNLARWRHGGKSGLWWAFALTFLIGASQSRLSLGIAIALFPLTQLPIKRRASLFKMLSISEAAALCSYTAFWYFDSLRERFLSGDLSIQIGDIAINGSGRVNFWNATFASFQDSPWIGKGAGAAEGLIESLYNIRHPHSDYMRVLHDYGLIGTTFWIFALMFLLIRLYGNWRGTQGVLLAYSRLQLTALLALVAFFLEMSMENAMVYIFITAPLGLVVGFALGFKLPSKSSYEVPND